MTYKFLPIFFAMIFCEKSFAQQNTLPANFYSPDKNISVNVFLVNNAQSEYDKKICYQLSKSGEVLVDTSVTGFDTDNAGNFGKGSTIKSVSGITTIKEKYQLVSGKALQVAFTANETSINLQNSKGLLYSIVVRVFNDGFAFRYQLPKQKNGLNRITVNKEFTSFKLPPVSKVWVQPYDSATQYTPGYENFYTNGTLPTVSETGEGWCFPLTAKVNNNWLLISEAALDGNYFASHLRFNPTQNAYEIKQPDQKDAGGYGINNAVMKLPAVTPWRCIVVASDLQNLVASQMIPNLNPPSVIKDVSWIKPGIASWSWWSQPDSPKDYDSLKAFVDFSADMHFPYSLVDANWNIMKGGDIKQLVDYAKKKNVGLWVWYNSGGPNNTVTEQPRDALFTAAKRKETFAYLNKMGIKGVKIDFFQSDKQEIIRQYIAILKEAAANKIMVNFHGCTLPRGWNRTYPNLLSTEAVSGAECYLFRKEYPVTAPIQNTILPFTRNVVGPMDYTPVTFSDSKFKHLTSSVHELALPIIFESGILHLADSKESYLSQSVFVQDYLRKLPVIWDEIKYISGEPGKEVVLARRKRNTWYIAGINGESTEKILQLNGFLKDTKYKITTLLEDADNSAVNNSTPSIIPENVTVKGYGGFVMVVTTQ